MQRTQIGVTSATRFYLVILELLIVLRQLFGDGIETLANMRFILIRRILHHIVAIFFQNRLISLANLVHVVGLEKGINGLRQSTDGHIQIQKLLHCNMNAGRNSFFLAITLPESLDNRLAETVCPKEFLEIQRIHLYDVL